MAISTEATTETTFEAKAEKVLHAAKDLFSSRPNWVTFFRETLGLDGSARNVFTTQDEHLLFQKTAEYKEIQGMIAQLRGAKNRCVESTKVITVRLPESLHVALKQEASDNETSMNKLCISKLLQMLSDEEEARPAPFRSQEMATANG